MRFVLLDFLQEAAQKEADEICIVPGSPLHIRAGSESVLAGDRLMPDDTEQIIRQIYVLAHRKMEGQLFERGDDNFSFTIPGVSRFRVSLFRQRNSFGGIIRLIRFALPSPAELNLPPEVMNAANMSEGLVLVAGFSGSGKTTTLASIVRQISQTRAGKMIITLENPLEYLHAHGKCLVVQREIFTDTSDYASGVEAALYQRPDVLMLSDMPTAEVVKKTIRAAQAGRLILSTLYGNSSVDALTGLLNMFAVEQQGMICAQLSSVLRMVIYQRLLPGVDRRYIPVFETVEMDDVLRELLRKNDMDGFRDAVTRSKTSGVVPFDRNIISMYRKQLISYEAAMDYAMNKTDVYRQIH